MNIFLPHIQEFFFFLNGCDFLEFQKLSAYETKKQKKNRSKEKITLAFHHSQNTQLPTRNFKKG